jgi:hypothetical protein
MVSVKLAAISADGPSFMASVFSPCVKARRAASSVDRVLAQRPDLRDRPDQSVEVAQAVRGIDQPFDPSATAMISRGTLQRLHDLFLKRGMVGIPIPGSSRAWGTGVEIHVDVEFPSQALDVQLRLRPFSRRGS